VAVCYRRSSILSESWTDPAGLVAITRDVGGRRAWAMATSSIRLGLFTEAASSYPGLQNLLLAARALGLAAAPSIWHLFRERDFKRVLGVPGDVDVLALVPVGYR
jgi:nitroreductase